MIFFAKSDRGRVREENQDSYGISEAQGKYLLAVVCDGMGGAAGGKMAAKLASSTYLDKFAFFYSDRFDDGEEQIVTPFEIKRIFSNAVYASNKVVYEKAMEDSELRGMGTTLTSALIIGQALYTANVGDSRVYIIRDGQAQRITKDNSYVQQLVDLGKISEEEARTYPGKNLITKAIGVREEIEPDFTCTSLEAGDVILLCSDGLTNSATDEEIAEILSSEGDGEQKINYLIQYANIKGGEDNVTAVVIEY